MPKLATAIDQLHVEVRRADEGQAGDGGGADQVQNAAETGNRLGDEQEDEDGRGPKHAAFPSEFLCEDKNEVMNLRCSRTHSNGLTWKLEQSVTNLPGC